MSTQFHVPYHGEMVSNRPCAVPTSEHENRELDTRSIRGSANLVGSNSKQTVAMKILYAPSLTP